jgi:hypothetical protein
VNFRTTLALGATVATAALALSACGLNAAIEETKTDGAYPDFTATPTATTPPDPRLTDPGTILRVGQSAIIGYRTLVTDDDGTVHASKDEQLITLTIEDMTPGSIAEVPPSDRLTGADSGGVSMSVQRVTWTAKYLDGSVIPMAKNGLEFFARGAGAYIVSNPSISTCPGRKTLGSAFDKGSTVTGCFLVVYQAGTTIPSVEQFVYRTPTELDPIVWKP